MRGRAHGPGWGGGGGRGRVTRLRQLLGGAGLIQSRHEGYVLTVAAGDVDVGRLELLLAQARDAAEVGDRHRDSTPRSATPMTVIPTASRESWMIFLRR